MTEMEKEAITSSGEDCDSFSLEAFGSDMMASPSLKLHHLSKTIVPTIMYCNKGGFIIVIPGYGVSARSNFDDAMAFVGEYVHQECYGQGRSLPKVVRSMWQDASDTVHSISGWLAIAFSIGLIGTIGAYLA